MQSNTIENKVTANDTIVKMINAANDSKLGELYKSAELYLGSLAKGGDARYRLSSALNRKPIEAVRLSDIDNNVKKLIAVSNPDESRVFLCRDMEEKVNVLLLEWEHAFAYRRHNLGVRNKILLHGPTGNGKTSMARHIAKLANLPFVEINSDKIIGSYLGSTSMNIHEIFKTLTHKCVLFWDEIDTIGCKRGCSDGSAASFENDRMVNSMLINIDKMGPDVIFIGATNRREILDPAFVRRFDEAIEIPKPSYEKKIEFRDWLGEYYDIPEVEWNALDVLSCESFSDIKTVFVRLARSYVLASILRK